MTCLASGKGTLEALNLACFSTQIAEAVAEEGNDDCADEAILLPPLHRTEEDGYGIPGSPPASPRGSSLVIRMQPLQGCASPNIVVRTRLSLSCPTPGHLLSA